MKPLCSISLAVSSALLLGCRAGQEADQESAATGGRGEHQTIERGPITLTVTTDKKQVTIAEPVRLTITVTSDPEIDCDFPELSEPLKDFEIRSLSAIVPRTLEDGRLERRRTMDLEAYVADEHEIPGLVVKFADSRRATGLPAATSKPAPWKEVASKPFTITVTSQLSGQFDPTAFRDIKGPVEIETPLDYRPWAAGTAVLLTVTVVILLVWWSRRKQRISPAGLILPHEWAHQELDSLLADDLLELGRVQEFYYRINGVLRKYIELRFAITAGEMTTEEFLRSLEADVRLTRQRVVLSEFLQACDLVKYARVAPSQEEIDRVVTSARNLIDETTGSDVVGSVEGGGFGEAAA